MENNWEPLVYQVVMSLTRTSGCLFQHTIAKEFPVFKINKIIHFTLIRMNIYMTVQTKYKMCKAALM